MLCDRAPGGLWTIITFITLLTVRASEIHTDCSYDFRLSPKRSSRISDEHSGRGSQLPISKGHITIITGTRGAYAERMNGAGWGWGGAVCVRSSPDGVQTRHPLSACLPPPPPKGAFEIRDGHPRLLPNPAWPPPVVATLPAIPVNSPWASPGLAVAFIFHAECAASQEPEACPAFRCIGRL